MKLNLLLALLFFNASLGIGQNDTLLSNLEANWQFNNYLIDGVTGTWTGWQTNDILINDSIMFNNKYWYSFYGNSSQFRTAYINTDSGKVYVKFLNYDLIQDTSSILLLYDFNLSQGDTAYYDEVNSGSPITVENISDTIIAGKDLRHFKLSNTDEWYSSIGSIHGLLTPLFFHHNLGGERTLCRYSGEYVDSTGVEYVLELGDIANCTAHLNEVDAVTYKLLSHPDYIVIQSDISMSSGERYELFSINSKRMAKGIINDSNQVLDWNDLSSGMYILKIGDTVMKTVRP